MKTIDELSEAVKTFSIQMQSHLTGKITYTELEIAALEVGKSFLRMVGQDMRSITPEESTKLSKEARRRFVKPTMEEMTLHADKIGLPRSEVILFFNHHEARGWKYRTGLPMASWQAAMVTWRENAKRFSPKAETTPSNDWHQCL